MAVLLQSCQETELGADLPYEGDRFVLYAELKPSEVVKLRLSKTYPPTGKFTVTSGLAGASVKLFENGLFKTQLAYSDSGNYVAQSGLKPKIGFAYSFEVALTGFPSANTQPVVIPQNVANAQAVLQKDTIASILTGAITRQLDVEWKDAENSPNDYLVTIEGLYQNQDLGLGGFNIGKDGEVEDGCSFARNRLRFVFKDNCFPAQTFKTSFGLNSFGSLQNSNLASGTRQRNVDFYRVSIANVSESYFRFLQDELQPTDIFVAFQLPKSRFSNVKNGYGIILAANETIFFVKAK